MFLALHSVVVNLLNVFLVGLPNFFKPSVAFPVVPTITVITTRSLYHIRCNSLHKLLYSISFLLPFACHFSPLVLSHLTACAFLCFNYHIRPTCHNISICVLLHSITVLIHRTENWILCVCVRACQFM